MPSKRRVILHRRAASVQDNRDGMEIDYSRREEITAVGSSCTVAHRQGRDRRRPTSPSLARPTSRVLCAISGDRRCSGTDYEPRTLPGGSSSLMPVLYSLSANTAGSARLSEQV